MCANHKTKKELKGAVLVKTIEKSTDFMKYKRLNENRELDENHVKLLKASFDEFGCDISRLIVVRTKSLNKDRKLEEVVVDGEHTRILCHRLGLPLNVEIVELADDTRMNIVKYMAVLNNSKKAWSNERYLRAYAELGIYEYQRILAIKKETGLTITDLLFIFFGSGEEQRFKKGESVFTDEKNGLRLLDATMSIKQFVPNKSFVRRSFFKICQNTCEYDKFAKAIIKTSKALAKGLSKFSENEKEFKLHLELIYKETFK